MAANRILPLASVKFRNSSNENAELGHDSEWWLRAPGSPPVLRLLHATGAAPVLKAPPAHLDTKRP